MHPFHRLALAVAVGLLAVPLAASAQELTRAEVRAQLEEARASGQLDRPGEAGATEAVIEARERANETDRLVAEAQQRLAAEAAAAPQERLASYIEEGSDGPQVVLLTFDAAGSLQSAETLALASID
jgi:hypothetical protein